MGRTKEMSAARLTEILASNDAASIRRILNNEHPIDIAESISSLDAEAVWVTLAQLPAEQQADVFGYFDQKVQVALAQSAQLGQLVEIISRMGADDRVDFFKELPETQQRTLLPFLAQADREDIRQLASYEEGTAGALMTSAYVSLREHLTAAQAIDVLRAEAPVREAVDRAYVVDDQRRLIGSVRLQDLILAQPVVRIGEIMDRNTLSGISAYGTELRV